MEQVLPPLFIAIAAFALCLALYALWQSLRGVFSSEHGRGPVGTESARARLVDEKAHVLQTLKDIRYERDLGKISDQDFEALNTRYRARAKQVLRELDTQLGPYRGKAEALIEGHATTDTDTGQRDKGSKAPASENKAPASESDQQACPACGKDNDADAIFCKACGKRIGGADGAGAEVDEGGAS